MMIETKSGVTLALGCTISLIALAVRLNARSIAWPNSASWGGQIEAAPFYATQLAIAEVANIILVFGLALVLAAVIKILFSKVP
jgi:hypothetical protein